MGETPISFVFCALAGMVLSLLSVTVVPAMDKEPESSRPAWVESDVDRPGSDFKILWLRGGVEACQEACAQNPQCKSYTYVKEGMEGRLEGCWLKNGVPPPVADGCCISGVKTDETLSRHVRAPVLPPQVTAPPPDGAKREASVRKSPPAEAEAPARNVPAAGSGKRDVGGLNYTALRSERAKRERIAGPVAVSPAAPVAGTGSRQVKGMDFVAVNPATAGRRKRSAAASEGVSRSGRRNIRGASYFASPPRGRKSVAERRREGADVRNVTGMDFKAVPPQR